MEICTIWLLNLTQTRRDPVRRHSAVIWGGHPLISVIQRADAARGAGAWPRSIDSRPGGGLQDGADAERLSWEFVPFVP